MRNKKLVIGAAAAGVIIAALAALLFSIDVNQFRQRIQAELQKQAGRPVKLGEMALGIFPLSIQVNDVSIGESAMFPTGRPFLTAKELRVRVGLLPLLRKEVKVHSIILRQPVIELVRNGNGQWNYSDLGGKSEKGSGGGGLSLGVLEIQEGTLAVSTLGAKASRSVYDRIDVTLSDLAPGKTFRLDAGVRLPDSGRDSLTIQATGGGQGVKDAPLTGRISLKDASVAGLAKFLDGGTKPQLEGLLSGDADVRSAGSLLTAKGGLTLAKARVQGSDLGYPVALQYNLSFNTESGVLSAPDLKLSVGDVPVGASATYNMKASTVDARAKVVKASLAELLALGRAFGVDGVSGSGVLSLDLRAQGPLKRLSYSGSGHLEKASVKSAALTKPVEIRTANLRFDDDSARLENLVLGVGSSTMRGAMDVRNFSAPEAGFTLDIDKLDLAELEQLTAGESKPGEKSSPVNLTAKGKVTAGKLLYSGLELNRVRSDVAFQKGVLTLAPVSAELYGGTQTGSIVLDTRANPPKLAMNTKMEGVEANQLLSSITSVKKALYGLLAMQGEVSMNLAEGDAATRSLNGKLGLNLTKGRLAGVNLLNEMASIGKFVGYSQSREPFTDIVDITGDMTVRDGVAGTDNLRLQVQGGAVAAAGTVNLVDQSLNLRITAVLDRATSQMAGGSRIGGLLTTALANDKGELVIPALVTGTFEKPRFMPDAGRVAEMKLRSVLPSTGSAGALAGGLMDAVKGQKGGGRSVLDALTGAAGGKTAGQPSAEGQQAQQPAAEPKQPEKRPGGILGGVLDSLRKRKEKAQEPPPEQK